MTERKLPSPCSVTGWQRTSQSALMLAELHLEVAEKSKTAATSSLNTETPSSLVKLHLQVALYWT